MDSSLSRVGVLRPRVILDPERIQRQLQYCADLGWTILIEHVHREGFAELFWDLWATPVCKTGEGRQALNDLGDCCRAFPDHFVRCTAYEGDRMNAAVRLTMLVQTPGAVASGLFSDRAETLRPNSAIPAKCFNAVRATLRAGGEPLILPLGGRLSEISMELTRPRWRCIDTRSDSALIIWSDFSRSDPVTLHQPVNCRMDFSHSAAGGLVRQVLLELYSRLGTGCSTTSIKTSA